MLKVTIPALEYFDDEKSEFVITKEQTFVVEHSLVSISKWESRWCKPFLTKDSKTQEETIDYIRCMTITQNVDVIVYDRLTPQNIKAIMDYIESPMTATVFQNTKKTISREIITAEIIYYWMVTMNIPFECQKWHLNKLLTLINVCQMKNQPAKRMSKNEVANRNAALNAARRKELNTKG